MSINKAIWEHSCACSFIYLLWLFLPYKDRVEWLQEKLYGLQSLKYFLYLPKRACPLQKKCAKPNVKPLDPLQNKSLLEPSYLIKVLLPGKKTPIK